MSVPGATSPGEDANVEKNEERPESDCQSAVLEIGQLQVQDPVADHIDIMRELRDVRQQRHYLADHRRPESNTGPKSGEDPWTDRPGHRRGARQGQGEGRSPKIVGGGRRLAGTNRETGRVFPILLRRVRLEREGGQTGEKRRG